MRHWSLNSPTWDTHGGRPPGYPSRSGPSLSPSCIARAIDVRAKRPGDDDLLDVRLGKPCRIKETPDASRRRVYRSDNTTPGALPLGLERSLAALCRVCSGGIPIPFRDLTYVPFGCIRTTGADATPLADLGPWLSSKGQFSPSPLHIRKASPQAARWHKAKLQKRS